MTLCKDYSRQSDGTWIFKDKEVPPNIRKRLDAMHIPDGWKHAVVSANPTAKLQIIGLDATGQWQYRFGMRVAPKDRVEMASRIAARRKFDRVKLFGQDLAMIRKNVLNGVRTNDAKAMLLRMEDKTVIRMGKEAKRGKEQAYGLTTLRGEHVQIEGNKVKLSFIAKKGISAHYEFSDDVLSSWLKDRKSRLLSMKDRMFPDVSPKKLNNYLMDVAGGKSYTIKDFRTYHGTRIAFEELQQYAGKMLMIKEKRKIVKKVCEKVSRFLRNTPAMAKGAYIDPMVWEIIGGI